MARTRVAMYLAAGLALSATFFAPVSPEPAGTAVEATVPAARTVLLANTGPTDVQIDAWLADYGLDDERARGELVVNVVADLTYDSGRKHAAGLYWGGDRTIALDAGTGLSAWVLAHEVGHWFLGRHPAALELGFFGAVPDVERAADCVAVVLLSGTDSPPDVTDCTAADLALAGQIIAGTPLTVDPDRFVSALQLREAGVSPYTADEVDAHSSYPTLTEILLVRDAAGLPATARQLAGDLPAPLTLELARSDRWPDGQWETLGIEVYEVMNLRLNFGADVMPLGEGVWAYDQRAYGLADVAVRITTDVTAAAGLSECWAEVLAVQVARDTALSDTCRRDELLKDANAWAALPKPEALLMYVPQRPDRLTLVNDEHRLATPEDVEEAACIGGLVALDPEGICAQWAGRPGSGWPLDLRTA